MIYMIWYVIHNIILYHIIPYITLYYIMSRYVISYHIIYHIISHHIISYHICHIISYHLSYHIILYYIIYYIVSYRIIYRIIYHIISYYIISYHTIILRARRRNCSPSLAETSVCCAWLLQCGKLKEACPIWHYISQSDVIRLLSQCFHSLPIGQIHEALKAAPCDSTDSDREKEHARPQSHTFCVHCLLDNVTPG